MQVHRHERWVCVKTLCQKLMNLQFCDKRYVKFKHTEVPSFSYTCRSQSSLVRECSWLLRKKESPLLGQIWFSSALLNIHSFKTNLAKVMSEVSEVLCKSLLLRGSIKHLNFDPNSWKSLNLCIHLNSAKCLCCSPNVVLHQQQCSVQHCTVRVGNQEWIAFTGLLVKAIQKLAPRERMYPSR